MMEALERMGYQKLLVWQRADEFVLEIYRATRSFPRDELYGLTSQLRRAAVSIPTNIVEGTGRQGRKELKQFVNVALGSHAEVEYLLGLSARLGYLDKLAFQELELKRNRLGGLLWKFYHSLIPDV